jgi:carboxyl-terminal processing protease
MSIPMQNKISRIGLCVLVLAGVFYAGSLYGKSSTPSIERVYGIENKNNPDSLANVDFEPFWKVWNEIDEKSPDAKKIDSQARVYGAVKGLIGSLNDPYSVFFTPEESKMFNDTIAGEFGGVGMEVGIKDKILTVIAPLKDTPAYKANIKSGDKILKIDNVETNDMTIDKAISLIRGKKGTSVTLTIYHEGDKKPQDITIVRDTITTPTIDSVLRDDGIYVISVYNFSANVAQLFKDSIQKFATSGSSKLIIDLRGNPGGYLDAAISMSSWFLPSGKTVVMEDFGDKADKQTHRSLGYDIFTDNVKIVILVDQGSASASEIFAGALHDNGKATLVGEKTYGKGSVQEVIPITKDTSAKITVAKWLTPNGISISKEGITPDVVVPITDKDVANKVDPQMAKAVEILTKK